MEVRPVKIYFILELLSSASMAELTRLRVYGSRVRVYDSRLRVEGLVFFVQPRGGFRVEGLGLRMVEGLWILEGGNLFTN